MASTSISVVVPVRQYSPDHDEMLFGKLQTEPSAVEHIKHMIGNVNLHCWCTVRMRASGGRRQFHLGQNRPNLPPASRPAYRPAAAVLETRMLTYRHTIFTNIVSALHRLAATAGNALRNIRARK